MNQEIINQLQSLQAKYQKKNRNLQAYFTILTAIKKLILVPGHSYLEREIADALKISRTPVREAFSRLEMEGWGEIVPRKGFKVEVIHIQTIKSISEIMSDLDGLATQLATPEIDDQVISTLKQKIEQQKVCLKKGDLLGYINIDDQFHNLIKANCPNKKLLHLSRVFSDQMYRARLYTIDKRKEPEHSILEHKAILAAIIAKDAHAARELVEFHRKKGSEEIISILGSD